MFSANGNKKSAQGVSSTVSVGTTLLRTACLILLTLGFMMLFRFYGPAIHAMQKVAGSGMWQSLYGVFHISSGLGREQLLLTGIMLFCFFWALIVQFLGMLVWKKFSRRLS